MSLFSKLFSGQINWETANSAQKLAALDELPSNDPVLGQLALGEPDAAVRHKAIGLMEAAAQLQIASSVRTGDENCLAASLGERIGEGGIAVDDALGALASATAGFRIALTEKTALNFGYHYLNAAPSDMRTEDSLITDRIRLGRSETHAVTVAFEWNF